MSTHPPQRDQDLRASGGCRPSRKSYMICSRKRSPGVISLAASRPRSWKPPCCASQAKNASLGILITRPTRTAGKPGWRQSSYALDRPMRSNAATSPTVRKCIDWSQPTMLCTLTPVWLLMTIPPCVECALVTTSRWSQWSTVEGHPGVLQLPSPLVYSGLLRLSSNISKIIGGYVARAGTLCYNEHGGDSHHATR